MKARPKMIKKVSFRNFKALRSVDLSLERLTVIVGPNASGKTSILQGLYYLSRLATIGPENFRNESPHPFDLYSRGGSGGLEVAVEMSEGRGCFKLTHVRPLPSFPIRTVRDLEAFSASAFEVCGQPVLEHALRGAALARLDPAKLASPSYSPDVSREVGPDGVGLPSVLASLALTFPEEWQELQDRAHQVIPAIRRIRLDRIPMYRNLNLGGEWVELRGSAGTGLKDQLFPFDLLLFDMEGAPTLRGQFASEGTLVVVGLLAILLKPPRPNLVLLDDLGHGLHPMAQQKLIGLLRTMMEEHPELQIVATTHSPYLLDSLRPEEVRLTTLDADGSAACAALTEHPDFERWKEEMTPGEFWSMIGEKWVAQRNGVGSPA
jgi:hypothetical protein